MSTSLADRVRDVSFYLVLVVFIATLGPLQFGYHLAELNAPEDVITCRTSKLNRVRSLFFFSRQPGDEHPSWLSRCIPMTEIAFATVSSIFTLGGLIGALSAGPVSSKRGRLVAMRLTALCYLTGSVTETLASGIVAMAAGRLITGLGAGASTVIVPLYISEVAPPAERGFFGAMTQVSINVGILATQTFGYLLSSEYMWRWVFFIGLALSAAQGVGLLVVPESPAWLAAHGKGAVARRTLQRIRGRHFDISAEAASWDKDNDGEAAAGGEDDDAAEEEESRLLGQPTTEPVAASTGPANPPRRQRTHLGFFEVVRDPRCRPAIVACVGIMVAQQLCGINSIVMYSVSLLADLLPFSSAILTIAVSFVNLAMTLACSPLPDRIGRKRCLLISIVGQGTSAFVLALSIVLEAKVLSAVAVVFFVAFFAVGLGPVPFIMASELVGQEAVGATQSWCLASNYTATFIVVQFFPLVNKWLNEWLGGAGGWVYFVFAGFAACSAVFVSWKVPETLGRKDVDEVWGRTRRID
ncbi:related to glucose transporter-3 [Cephalotrichum gorgonifer]|uniref:Related to glucose transporter-3 n=1 Tax=Cephalotrichum gorgonifer TaxID=2041049 RepID=A0AAE8SZD6_9PEZI|nr:related to glucose transporter-3 [Cephalotrichum gorgonifer]